MNQRAWKMRYSFVILALVTLASAGYLTAGSVFFKIAQFGGLTVWFDETTITQGDILAKVDVHPTTGAALTGGVKLSAYQAVKFPTESIDVPLTGRWYDQVLAATEDVSSRADTVTLLYEGTGNFAGQHAQVFRFDAALEKFIDTKVKLPAHLADTGTVTVSYFWSEAAGETDKKNLWKFQHKPLAAGETHDVSPSYLTVQGATANTSLTMKETQFVSTVSALGWNENDVVYMQIGRSAASTDDDAAGSYLHHVGLEVPIITHRTP